MLIGSNECIVDGGETEVKKLRRGEGGELERRGGRGEGRSRVEVLLGNPAIVFTSSLPTLSNPILPVRGQLLGANLGTDGRRGRGGKGDKWEKGGRRGGKGVLLASKRWRRPELTDGSTCRLHVGTERRLDSGKGKRKGGRGRSRCDKGRFHQSFR